MSTMLLSFATWFWIVAIMIVYTILSTQLDEDEVEEEDTFAMIVFSVGIGTISFVGIGIPLTICLSLFGM